jgi:hypothetical protein
LIDPAYPSWPASEETFALYESILIPLSVESVEHVVMENIRSPAQFAPTVAMIYTAALELDMRKREIEAERNRRREPGAICYTPSGQRMEAGKDGILRQVPEPEPKLVATQFSLEARWLERLNEKANEPRVMPRRALGRFAQRPERLKLIKRPRGKLDKNESVTEKSRDKGSK